MNGDCPSHDDLLDLVAVMALGSLGAEEQRTVTLHMAGCAECRAEFAALRPAADAIGLTAEEIVDDARTARMRERIFAQITPVERRRRSSIFTWTAGLVAAASLVFALASTIQNVGLRTDVAARGRAISELDARVAAEARERTVERTTIADLIAPDAKHYGVRGGDVVRRGDRLYIAMRSLPALPKGKVYQAWTIGAGSKTPAPSVTFIPTRTGIDVVRLPGRADRIAGVALTVEPEGGSRRPTSKPTFLRKLS